MKNILFLTDIYPGYGGVEKVTTILANQFVKLGHGVSIAYFKPHNIELLQELDNRVKLYKLDRPVPQRRNKMILRKAIKDDNIRIIINQWCVPFYVTKLCRDAATGLNVKILSVHHNQPNTNFKIKNVEIAMEKNVGNKFVNMLKLHLITMVSRISLRLSLHYSDRYIVLAPRFVSICKQFMAVKNTKKIISLPNPITCPELSHCITKKEKEIIYVGRIEYNQKRTFRLLDVWGKLSVLHPDWKLTIVGDGPDWADFENRIKKQNLKNIHVEGFKSPIPYYQRAACLLLLSEYEGFPLVIGEAMNYSVVPIVLGSFDAIYDIITDKHDGIILKHPYDCDECSNEIDWLINNDGILRKMSYATWQTSKKYSINTVTKKWENLFEEIS